MNSDGREVKCNMSEKSCRDVRDASVARDNGAGKGENTKEIYFAGGCFWGVEEYFSRIPGVLNTEAGYANGKTENPSYEKVCAGNTGHAETVRVCYDPAQVELEVLVKQYFRIIDPTIKNRQGNDVGSQYRTGIYYSDPYQQPRIAAVMAEEAKNHSKPIVTELTTLKSFYGAEEYHQDYLKKNPFGYCHIDFSGLAELKADREENRRGNRERDRKENHERDCKENCEENHDGICKNYMRPSQEELRRKLTALEYQVTQKGATEKPFSGAYWNHNERGIYVDAATGEPLFFSGDKFDSGCGWPSFTRPVARGAVSEREDNSHGMHRREVRSAIGESHLGHVFEDGPADRGGLRYCINSAALRFIPFDRMEEEGYGAYKDRV